MFCAKCGAQIRESDQFCPKCGKENINFVESNKITQKKNAPTYSEGVQDTVSNGENKPLKQKKWILPLIIIGVIAVLGALGCMIFSNKGSGLIPSTTNKVAWSPWGIYGDVDEEGTIHFVEDGIVTSFEGKMKSGRSTPDHSKYLTLTEEGILQVFVLQEGAYSPTTIGENVESILTVNNDGCFYTSGTNEHLYYYGFSDHANVDTGLEDCDFDYSNNRNTVIGVSESGEIRIFTKGDSSARVLCNADKDADICCIADDGSNVVWGVKDGNAFGIYMLKNGAPERIGKITNSEKYSYVQGFFYNNDKSFIVYSSGSAQIIWSQNDEIKELALPGVKGNSNFYDQNGQYIDSDEDYIAEPYLIIRKTKSSDTGGLYKLTKEGSFVLEIDDITLYSNWDGSAYSYYIRNGTVFYINKDGDLYKKQLGEGNDNVLITTDVKALYIPEQGKYCYLVKAGSLYYIDLSDKDNRLNMIWNKLTDDDTVALTDKPNVLYFITNTQDITDSYLDKGTLYRFVVGEEAGELAEDIMSIRKGDAKSVSADHPIFSQYVSHEEYDYIINIGTCSDGEYKVLINSVEY